jgi:hypothetical protein
MADLGSIDRSEIAVSAPVRALIRISEGSRGAGEQAGAHE